MNYSLLYKKLIDFSKHCGKSTLKNELWVGKIDKRWTVTINGHNNDEHNIPPFGCRVRYDSSIVALITADGGAILGNMYEDELIKAIDKAIK